MSIEDNISQALPYAIGLGVVIISFTVYKIYFSKNKDKTFLDKRQKEHSKRILLENGEKKYAVPLLEIEEVSHDSKMFKFGLPTKEHSLGLPVGQHINLIARVNGELVIRAYTPITLDEVDKGIFTLMIKIYFKDVNPKFPNGGVMSQYLNSLKIGDTIDIRGPAGRIEYKDYGEFSIKKSRKDPPTIIKVKRINFIAGGTGITPVYQIMRYINLDPLDKTEISLIYANKEENDILIRDYLDNMNTEGSVKIWYTLDTPPPGWKYSTGFINPDMIRDHLFPPSEDTITLMCGPPPMINFACLPSLEKLGYDKDLIFAF